MDTLIQVKNLVPGRAIRYNRPHRCHSTEWADRVTRNKACRRTTSSQSVGMRPVLVGFVVVVVVMMIRVVTNVVVKMLWID
jgi:hypothetical protein